MVVRAGLHLTKILVEWLHGAGETKNLGCCGSALQLLVAEVLPRVVKMFGSADQWGSGLQGYICFDVDDEREFEIYSFPGRSTTGMEKTHCLYDPHGGCPLSVLPLLYGLIVTSQRTSESLVRFEVK